MPSQLYMRFVLWAGMCRLWGKEKSRLTMAGTRSGMA
jgi:hypothetical protein